MNRRQGFTLIELLIVVTIVAILAGAAVPYVQDYVDQARTSRAKADIDEIKRALMLYEVQYGEYTGANIASLVGPFLTRNLPDPWGNAYVVSNAKSTVSSYGPDGDPDGGDDVSAEFRPRMAVTRVNFVDIDGDGVPTDGDLLSVKVCRPVATNADLGANLKLLLDGVDSGVDFGTGEIINSNLVQLTLDVGATNVVLSKSKLQISTSNNLKDENNTAARVDEIKVLYE